TTGLYLYYQDNPNKQTSHFGENADMLGSPDKNFSLINTNKSKSHGAALYGQLSYPISKKLQIIAGARYDYEKKKYSVMSEYQPDNSDPFTILPDTSASVDFSAFSPKLGLAWEIQKNSQFYFNYSRGFRTGGLTQLSTDPTGQPPLYPYKPEHSHSFEAGLKNSFLQNHFRLNLALFYAKVNDAQVPTLILPDAITVTRNAGKLESRGAELELGATPLKGLELQYNFGYTHAEYTELKIPDNGQQADRSGNRQVFTPDITSQLAVQFSQPLMEDPQLNLVLRGEWAYLGKQYFDLANQISQPGYSMLNGRVGLSMKQWELMFWIRNIGDKKYIAYAYDFGAVHLGNPRTLGITLRWQY
ncbi:MAG TPA: TonB-dependent receptor, partial [Chitinophagaceae bacterium]|nr:TonB-dependent receptor [Chitinophagaceae bacterium]